MELITIPAIAILSIVLAKLYRKHNKLKHEMRWMESSIRGSIHDLRVELHQEIRRGQFVVHNTEA